MLAEWLVGRLLGVDLTGHRDPWGPQDLVTADGTTVEVKSTCSVQAWCQEGTRPGAPAYGGLLTAAERTGAAAPVRAQVYVFGLLEATDDDHDALNVAGWQWRVVPGSEVRSWQQQSIRHSVLVASGWRSLEAADLGAAVSGAASAEVHGPRAARVRP